MDLKKNRKVVKGTDPESVDRRVIGYWLEEPRDQRGNETGDDLGIRRLENGTDGPRTVDQVRTESVLTSEYVNSLNDQPWIWN